MKAVLTIVFLLFLGCVPLRAEVVNAVADSTQVLQGLLDAGRTAIVPCGSPVNIASLSIPAAGGSIRGECQSAVIHVTTNSAAIGCNDVNGPVSISDLVITGNAADYVGTTNMADLGQRAVHLSNCTNVSVRNVSARNIAGTAFDCEAPASGFNLAAVVRFSDVSATNSYRGFWTRNSCEYAVFSNVTARNNVFGMVVSSGNISVSGFELVWNYNNLQIVGQANGNPCHGTFTGGVSNHGVYNLDILSCGLGQNFSGVNFIADQSGSLEAGGVIRIANSRGVNIVGGILGSKVVVVPCDPVTGSCSLAGANKIDGTYVRDDVSGCRIRS